jgi:hypothetical protein
MVSALQLLPWSISVSKQEINLLRLRRLARGGNARHGLKSENSAHIWKKDKCLRLDKKVGEGEPLLLLLLIFFGYRFSNLNNLSLQIYIL